MITPASEEHGTKIHAINANNGIFIPEEVECVDDLWVEYQTCGAQASGYYFLVEQEAGKVLGYTCYGPRALTDRTYDLYWIAVDLKEQRAGVGRALLGATEEAVRKLGGRLLIAETSGQAIYTSTRTFYASTGYKLEATIKDFYGEGDDLVIFTKHL